MRASREKKNAEESHYWNSVIEILEFVIAKRCSSTSPQQLCILTSLHWLQRSSGSLRSLFNLQTHRRKKKKKKVTLFIVLLSSEVASLIGLMFWLSATAMQGREQKYAAGNTFPKALKASLCNTNNPKKEKTEQLAESG